jgi:hypothetical protein
MFIKVLFTNSQNIEAARHPLMNQWIKMRYMYLMEFYSVTEKNEIVSFARK